MAWNGYVQTKYQERRIDLMSDEVEYDLQALKDGLTKIDKNIAIFEQAIAAEHATKADYRRMIRALEDKLEAEMEMIL